MNPVWTSFGTGSLSCLKLRVGVGWGGVGRGGAGWGGVGCGGGGVGVEQGRADQGPKDACTVSFSHSRHSLKSQKRAAKSAPKADTSKKECFFFFFFSGTLLVLPCIEPIDPLPGQGQCSCSAQSSGALFCPRKKRTSTYSWMKAGSTISPHFGLVILILLHTKGSAIYFHPGVAMCNVCFTPLFAGRIPVLVSLFAGQSLLSGFSSDI